MIAGVPLLTRKNLTRLACAARSHVYGVETPPCNPAEWLARNCTRTAVPGGTISGTHFKG